MASNNDIDINDILYRRIHPDNMFWDKEFNRPSRAAYIDKNGLSVEKLSYREEIEVIDSFKRLFGSSIRCMVKISVKKCFDIQLYPVNKPLPDNEFHAEIHDSVNKKKLSNKKASDLAKEVKIVNIS